MIFSGFLLQIIRLFTKNKKRIENFAIEEKKEIEELEERREGWQKFWHHSKRLFKEYFIPHEGNGHKPKFLRARSLTILVLSLLLLKAGVVGYLFLSYPQDAHMSEEIVRRVFELINQDRAAGNVGTLGIQPVLTASAQAKADDMVAEDYFSHYSPDGRKPWDFIDRGEYPYIYVGENLAMNFTSAESVHRALMASESHKKNIMNPRYSDIGLAMVSGMINGKETNILVEMFGAEKTALAAAPAKSAPPAAPSPSDLEIAVAGEEKSLDQPAAPAVQTQPDASPETAAPPSDNTAEQTTVPEPEPAAPAQPESESVPAPVEPKTVDVKEATTEAMTSQSETAEIPEPTPLPPTLPPTRAAGNGELALAIPEVSGNVAARTAVIRMENPDATNLASLSRITRAINYIFLTVMALLIIALIVNIIVRLEIQHKPVIVQTLLVIILVGSFWFFKLHYLETGVTDILLLSF